MNHLQPERHSQGVFAGQLKMMSKSTHVCSWITCTENRRLYLQYKIFFMKFKVLYLDFEGKIFLMEVGFVECVLVTSMSLALCKVQSIQCSSENGTCHASTDIVYQEIPQKNSEDIEEKKSYNISQKDSQCQNIHSVFISFLLIIPEPTERHSQLFIYLLTFISIKHVTTTQTSGWIHIQKKSNM